MKKRIRLAPFGMAAARAIAAGLCVVTLLAGAAGAAQLSLTWTDASSNEDGFKVERATGTTGAYGQLATVAAGASGYVDTAVTAGTTYCYRVRAYNTAGDSAYSNAACGTPASASLYTVTVGKAGAGSGTVASSPSAINCGSTCTASVASGTSLALSATPATGSTFSGWSGACTGSGNCALVVDGAKNLTATFATSAPSTYTLSLTKSGTGSGTVSSSPAGVNCGSTCSYSFNSGTSVTLTAAAATGSTFTGWGGACTGTGTCAVSMTAARSVTATFTVQASQTSYSLTVTKSGTGSGTVTSNASGINCGSTCSANFASGTSTTLTAAAATGSTFTGWGGACTGTGTCTVSMTAARSVTATFTVAAAGNSLVAAYGFTEGSGTATVDAAGNGLTGTLSNTTWTTSGKNGNALTFNGTTSWVTVNDTPALDLTTGLTVMAWVYPTTVTNWRTAVLKETAGDHTYALYAADGNGRPAAHVNLGSQDVQVSGSSSLALNTWSHLALTYDGATLRLFVNGTQVGSQAAAGAVVTSTGPLRVGGNGIWGEYFQGRIDEVRIYNRAVSTSEFQTGMTTPVGGKPQTIGVYRAGWWYLNTYGNDAWDGCTTDKCIALGVDATDTPVVGDWNGDGKTKVGVYRAGWWHLDYNGNGQWDGCTTDKCIALGVDATDTPVVGDWNGDGKTKVGTFRSSDGTFYLDYNGNGAWDGCTTDKCIKLALNGDTPLVGDWNGDGKTKVGTFRSSDGTFYLDYNGNGAWDGCTTDKCIKLALNGDTPLVGDWNGDGKTKAGVYRNGWWYLDYNGNGAWDGCTTDKCIALGSTGDTVVVGDWNGDGKTKAGTYRAGWWYLDYNGNGAWDGCTTDKCIANGLPSGDKVVVGRW